MDYKKVLLLVTVLTVLPYSASASYTFLTDYVSGNPFIFNISSYGSVNNYYNITNITNITYSGGNTSDQIFGVCNNYSFSLISEPKWFNNYTAFNSSWSSTFNSSYNALLNNVSNNTHYFDGYDSSYFCPLNSTACGGTSSSFVATNSYKNYLVNGTWIVMDEGATALTASTASSTINSIHFVPFLTTRNVTFDAIALTISTANARSNCTIGIYNDTGNVYPMALLPNTTFEVNLSSANTTYFVKNKTFNPLTLKNNSLYWGAFNCNNITTMKVYGIPNAELVQILGISIYANSVYNNNYRLAYTQNSTLPSIVSNGATMLALTNPFLPYMRIRTDITGTVV